MKHVGKSEMEAKSKIFFKWCLTKRTLKPFFLQPRRINVYILRWGGFLFYSPGEIPRFIFVREIDSSFIPRGKRSVYSKSLCVIDLPFGFQFFLKRCGGSLVAHQTSWAEVPASNPSPPTMIVMRCRIIV